MPQNGNTDYINSTDYKTLEDRLKDLLTSINDLLNKGRAARKLRYAEVDIEAEREEGRFQPDELYIPQHIIDTNIRREQSPYVQYVTQSPRAVILEDCLDPSIDLSLLERDITKKVRFPGWQLSMFSNIDCFQANGYSIMELVADPTAPGEVSYEAVQYADFGFVADTRDLQAVEMVGRAMYFTKTRLKALCGDINNPKPETDWNWEQVEKVLKSDTNSDAVDPEEYNNQERSLHKVYKIMFRVDGIVQVAWASMEICDNWLRDPRPLYIGRRKIQPPQQPGVQVTQQSTNQLAVQMISQGRPVPNAEEYETEFPYYLFPYLISENDTISNLKGRVFLDQDTQEAVSSLISSACTQARRAAGMYFSKDVSDPNDDLLLQKNIFFRPGCIINSKVTAFKLDAPDPSIFSAIQILQNANSNETSQVNFAVANRKDSRKTAKEISVAEQQSQVLSTVQVVLFSLALKRLYSAMISVIQTRVLSGLIKVDPTVLSLYARKIIVKPSGDTDVIEKQQQIQAMSQAWEVVSQTAIAIPFLCKMLELMFPVDAPKYVAMLQQAQQQQQSQQAQQMQQVMEMVKQMAAGVVKLSQNPGMFSETGRIHALPVVEHFADMIKAFEQSQQPKQIQQGSK